MSSQLNRNTFRDEFPVQYSLKTLLIGAPALAIAIWLVSILCVWHKTVGFTSFITLTFVIGFLRSLLGSSKIRRMREQMAGNRLIFAGGIRRRWVRTDCSGSVLSSMRCLQFVVIYMYVLVVTTLTILTMVCGGPGMSTFWSYANEIDVSLRTMNHAVHTAVLVYALANTADYVTACERRSWIYAPSYAVVIVAMTATYFAIP